jgi:hypothetical protein
MLIRCTVRSGQTDSETIHIGGDVGQMGLVAVVTPAALTSTTMTIVASIDGTNGKVHTDYLGNSPTIALGTDRYISLDPALYCGMPYVVLSVGSAEAADRDFYLVVREVS